LSLLSPLLSAVPPLLSAAAFQAKDDEFQRLGRRVREATCNPFPAPFAASLAGASPKVADFPGAQPRWLQIRCKSSERVREAALSRPA
jgi:hypothetical protein